MKKILRPNDQSFQDNYKVLIGSILPRPIAVVGTRNLDGSFNLAPFSFFTAVCASPMILAFCPMIRTSTGTKKDTVINIEREGEFTVSICNEQIVEKVNLASTELPYGQDEFAFAGLTPLPSSKIKAPILGESPINFECKLRDILNYGENIGGGRLITGEVIAAHIETTILIDQKIKTDLLMPVARGAGNDWFRCTDIFTLERKMANQIQK